MKFYVCQFLLFKWSTSHEFTSKKSDSFECWLLSSHYQLGYATRYLVYTQYPSTQLATLQKKEKQKRKNIEREELQLLHKAVKKTRDASFGPSFDSLSLSSTRSKIEPGYYENRDLEDFCGHRPLLYKYKRTEKIRGTHLLRSCSGPLTLLQLRLSADSGEQINFFHP